MFNKDYLLEIISLNIIGPQKMYIKSLSRQIKGKELEFIGRNWKKKCGISIEGLVLETARWRKKLVSNTKERKW